MKIEFLFLLLNASTSSTSSTSSTYSTTDKKKIIDGGVGRSNWWAELSHQSLHRRGEQRNVAPSATLPEEKREITMFANQDNSHASKRMPLFLEALHVLE